MRATVCFSAIFGAYDLPKPAPNVPGVDFVMFTDDKRLDAPGWEIVAVGTEYGEHPRISAKRFKLLPHLFLPDAERTVWVDGGHTIISGDGIEAALACVGDDGIALHRHPGRDCIYQEAEASLPMPKYQRQPIEAQTAAYRKQGHPEHWGLWACGSMARVRSRRLDDAMDDWWEESLVWSYQDQISFPVIMRRAGLTPAEFPHHQYASPWFTVGGHTRDD